jgi:hypothetical protein
VRDLRGMEYSAAAFWRLYGTVSSFKSHVRQHFPTAATLPLIVLGSDTLGTLLDRMSVEHKHRAFVCTADGQCLHVITQRDLLRAILAIMVAP